MVDGASAVIEAGTRDDRGIRAGVVRSIQRRYEHTKHVKDVQDFKRFEGLKERARVFAAALLVACFAIGIAAGCSAPVARTDRVGAIVPDAPVLEQRASGIAFPQHRATMFLDAADGYLAAGRTYDAKRCIDAARESYYAGELAGRTNELLGAVYLETGEVTLAERYLLKGLEDLGPGERDLAFARLAICAEARGDDAWARRYRERIAAPNSPAVLTILTRRVVANLPPTRTSTTDALRAREARRAQPRRGALVDALPAVQPLPRSAWSPRPVIRNRLQPMTKIYRITIHHTAGESFWAHDRGDVADRIRAIQNSHLSNNGWGDIGYHWLIDRSGKVWQGRALNYQGAHVSEQNPGNIGIALLGNYEVQQLTPAQQQALEAFVVQLAQRYRVKPAAIHTHGEISPNHTQCPGRHLARAVDTIRHDLRQRDYLALGK